MPRHHFGTSQMSNKSITHDLHRRQGQCSCYLLVRSQRLVNPNPVEIMEVVSSFMLNDCHLEMTRLEEDLQPCKLLSMMYYIMN